MAAASNAEHTQLQDMEEEEAEVEEREMEAEEDEQEEQEEDEMAEEEEEEEDEDSSEDEKENEAEIQRLEEQVAAVSFSYQAIDNEWMDENNVTAEILRHSLKCQTTEYRCARSLCCSTWLLLL